MGDRWRTSDRLTFLCTTRGSRPLNPLGTTAVPTSMTEGARAAHRTANPYRPPVIHTMSWVGTAAFLLFLLVNVRRGIPTMVVADGLAVIVMLVNLAAYRRHGNATVATLVGCSTVAAVSVLGAHFVGTQVLALLAPLAAVAFFLLGRAGGTLFVLGLLALVGGWIAVFTPQFIDTRPPVDLVVAFVLVGVVSYVNERVRGAYARDLERLSSLDSLTGALNRRTCERILRDELERAERYDRSLGVALFDVDHFKRINDRYGHPAGDDVLRDIAHRVRSTLRKSDALVRWGGEEFLVLLPETDAGGAMAAAERIRRLVGDDPAELGVHTTISVGVASWRRGEDGAALIQRADDRLYRAKREGRNRVCGPDAPTEGSAVTRRSDLTDSRPGLA